MLDRIVTDPRAWTAKTIDSPRSWYYQLSSRAWQELDRALEAIRRQPRPVVELQVHDFTWKACQEELVPVSEALESGRGFAIVEGLSPQRYSAQDQQIVYWLLGQLLGIPFPQNVQGVLLYDVKDTGQDVRYGARFSVTNAESTFHTDNSFGTDVLDYVGLLCLNSARTGGLSQVVSAYAIHNVLYNNDPEDLKVLYQAFHMDRRGGVRPGDSPTIRFPIFQWNGQELTCRYLRYWIEVGHDKAGEPLNCEQIRALDTLDRVANDPDLRVEFALKPGDQYYINNRWILHNRTAFEDHPDPDKRRHLVRLWLRSRGFPARPLVCQGA